MAKKEDFYEELDTKGKRSFCTCQTLILGFVICIIIIVVLVVVMVKKVTTVVAPLRKVVSTSQNSTELQQKLADLRQAPGASTALVLTEQELTQLLVEQISRNAAIPLRDVQAQIDPQGVTLTGKATKLFNTGLTIILLPQVTEGRVKLELVSIKAGSLDVPRQLTESIAEALDDALGKELDQLSGVMVKSIKLDEGQMQITGTISQSTPTP
jgi:uncharacterized protein YpmS